MIRWNVRRLAEKRGVQNPYQLAQRAGISYPTAHRLWQPEQPALKRVEADVLEGLMRALDAKPSQLLSFE